MDLYITYRITPDLSSEWNPLISHFNLSWMGFIAAQTFLVLLAVVGYHRYAQRIRKPVDTPGLHLPQFVYYYFNGHEATPRQWAKGFLRLPTKRYLKINGAFIGFVIASSFMLTSVFAIVHNVLILRGIGSYIEFVIEHGDVYLPAVFILLVVLSANVFFVMEYKVYRELVQE